eukprot:151667_1
MTIRGDYFKDRETWKVVYDELIAWMRKLLLTLGTKDTALAMFGRAFLKEDERKVSIFTLAFNRSLSIKNTVFDRILMYLDCPSFYDLEAIHPHFLDNQLLRDKQDPKIANW